MPDVTRILSQFESDDPHVAEQLLPLVCYDLRVWDASDGPDEANESGPRAEQPKKTRN